MRDLMVLVAAWTFGDLIVLWVFRIKYYKIGFKLYRPCHDHVERQLHTQRPNVDWPYFLPSSFCTANNIRLSNASQSLEIWQMNFVLPLDK